MTSQKAQVDNLGFCFSAASPALLYPKDRI